MNEVEVPGPTSGSTHVRTWDIIAFTTLTVIAAIVILVWFWHPSGTNAPTEWLCLATGVLAFVTTVLAGATVVTARQTARTAAIAEEDLRQGMLLVSASNAQVDAARKQSELSAQTLSESRRPVLIPCVDESIVGPRQVSFLSEGGQRSKEVQDFPVVLCFPDGNSDWVVVKIRNVGGGPAIVGSELNDLTLEEEGMGRYHGFLVSRVVAPGDEVPVAFRLAKAIQPLRFWISITYRDLSYERRYRGRFVFDQMRPQPLLLDVTIEDLNIGIDLK